MSPYLLKRMPNGDWRLYDNVAKTLIGTLVPVGDPVNTQEHGPMQLSYKFYMSRGLGSGMSREDLKAAESFLEMLSLGLGWNKKVMS